MEEIHGDAGAAPGSTAPKAIQWLQVCDLVTGERAQDKPSGVGTLGEMSADRSGKGQTPRDVFFCRKADPLAGRPQITDTFLLPQERMGFTPLPTPTL